MVIQTGMLELPNTECGAKQMESNARVVTTSTVCAPFCTNIEYTLGTV